MNTKKDKKNPDGMALRAYLDNLPYSKSIETRKAITTGCLIPAYQLSNWASGRVRIPELYKQKMEEIAGEPIFKKL